METQMVLIKCSKCNRIKVNNNWLPEPRFLARHAGYTYACCSDCLAAEMEIVENHSPERAIRAASAGLRPQPVHA
ncbi:MAG: hypothetical protein WCN95_09615 [bacterium]